MTPFWGAFHQLSFTHRVQAQCLSWVDGCLKRVWKCSSRLQKQKHKQQNMANIMAHHGKIAGKIMFFYFVVFFMLQDARVHATYASECCS